MSTNIYVIPGKKEMALRLKTLKKDVDNLKIESEHIINEFEDSDFEHIWYKFTNKTKIKIGKFFNNRFALNGKFASLSEIKELIGNDNRIADEYGKILNKEEFFRTIETLNKK